MQDPHHLRRFIDAQAAVYPLVVRELEAGRKESHWMWFIFPQMAGLGRTAMAQRYAIRTLDEAQAYTEHPVLGPRLTDCTQLLLNIRGDSIEDILGFPDNLKFRSSMTLFSQARPDLPAFHEALAKFFNGEEDARTTDLLSGQGKPGNHPSM